MKNSILMLLAFATSFVYADSLTSVGSQTPRIVVDDKPVPLSTAPENKKVMLVDFELTFKKGELVAAKTKSSRTLASYAPKVFGMKTGDWKVILNGDPELSFFTHNPGLREVEPDGNQKGYSWTAVSDSVEWPLIIPLYKGNTSFNVKSLQIVDVVTKKVIATVEL